MIKREWSAEETSELLRMKEAGHSIEVIACSLRRTFHSVKERWRWARTSEEQKQDKIKGAMARRRASGVAPSCQLHAVTTVRPPTELLMEREYRLSLPCRDLTAALFGDPPPGYSALDRRGQS